MPARRAVEAVRRSQCSCPQAGAVSFFHIAVPRGPLERLQSGLECSDIESACPDGFDLLNLGRTEFGRMLQQYFAQFLAALQPRDFDANVAIRRP